MSTLQPITSWGIMSVNIDANSRAPPLFTSSVSQHSSDDTTYQANTASHSRESLAQSHISFRSGVESERHLLHHSPRSNAYHRDVDNERRIWREAQRTKVEKFSDELRSKLSKVRQTILRESTEALETGRLLQTCRTSPLAAKVQKARKTCAQKQRSAFQASSSAKGKEKAKEQDPSTNPTPGSSSPGSPFPSLPGLSTGSSSLASTPLDTRKGSIASMLSALSPHRSSTTTLNLPPAADDTMPLRQRKISAPLEYDPSFHPRQLSQSLDHRNGSIASESAPLFRMPRWTPPSPDDCRACEIIRIVPHTNTIHEEGGEARATKVLRRLSDEKGNLFIEQVRDRDERGKKRVLLSWGVDVDVVIPERGGDRKSRLRRRLGKGYLRLCEMLKKVFAEEEGGCGEADALWEVYP